MKFLVSASLLLLTTLANANDALPSGCQPVAVQEPLRLMTKQPVVMMIHNLSANDLWLTHPVTEAKASAGWSSRLETNHWSALVLDKDAFELTCIESKPGHEQQVPCTGMIAICAWPTTKIPTTLTGTFWAGENMALSALTAHLTNRGFALPASAQ